MLVCRGKGVCEGIAIGKIKVLKKNHSDIEMFHTEESEAELLRFSEAKKKAENELEELYKKAKSEVGEENAAIIEIHRMMLEDSDFNASIENMIQTKKVNAEYAVWVTGENFSEKFSSVNDEYMRSRATDVKDISERLIACLLDIQRDEAIEKYTVIAAEELMPSETVKLDKKNVTAFVTAKGSENSHTAILAKTLNIPSVIGCEIGIDSTLDGKTAIVNGFTGEVYIEPDEETLADMHLKIEHNIASEKFLDTLKGKENITLDGRKIQLYANIGNIEDIDSVLMNDGGGIGLFRSEFIYLGRNDFPCEEEQFEIYKKAAEAMGGRKTIIRTLDIGADKKADYFNLKDEENSAMGYRAIRICLKEPHILKTQLRAIFRAGVYGNISVMYPMITSVDEIRKIKFIADEVKSEMKSEGISFADIEQGIMIETPAAVLISDDLAKEADFFSIGTNDLIQYTLAADRQNEMLDDFYNPHHKAVLRMIKMSIDNAHKNGIWAGICGELGADTELTELFLAMGIDELSVTPSSILKVRKKILETNVGKVDIKKWI